MIHLVNRRPWKFKGGRKPHYLGRIQAGNKHEIIPLRGILPNEDGLLPEGKFTVSKDNGQIVVYAGEDKTERALAFLDTSVLSKSRLTLSLRNVEVLTRFYSLSANRLWLVAIFEPNGRLSIKSLQHDSQREVNFRYENGQIHKGERVSLRVVY